MELLKASDEMKDFIHTAQKLVDAWDADPDNYSQLEEGLTALKAALRIPADPLRLLESSKT